MTTRIWNDLPLTLRRRIADRLGGIGPAEPVAGGFTPGVRVRMPQADERAAFVKAIPAGDPAASMYRTEGVINRYLPAGAGPRLLCALEEDGWIVLSFDYAEGRNPDLSPGSPDLTPVLDSVAALQAPLTPCPYPDAPDFIHHPVVERAAAHHEAMRGNTLLHCDIRSDNLLIGDTVLFVDWALAHRGAAWLDIALLIPQLILAGHTPEEAEGHAARIPAYQDVPTTAVSAFASSVTAYWELRAQEGGPELRKYRARAMNAGRAWTAYRSQ